MNVLTTLRIVLSMKTGIKLSLLLLVVVVVVAPLFIVWVYDVKDFYPSVFADLIATLLGVLFAFEIERNRDKQLQESDFDASLKALDYELEQNLAILNRFRKSTTTKSFSYVHVTSTMIEVLLQQPTTIRFGGEVLLRSLHITRTRINAFNKACTRFEEHAYASRGLSQTDIDWLADAINQTQYVIALARELIRKYQQSSKALLEDTILVSLDNALKLETRYRSNDLKSAYEKLKKDVVM